MAVMAAELVRLNIKADGDGKQTTPKRIRLDSTPSSYAFDTHVFILHKSCTFAMTTILFQDERPISMFLE